MWERFSYYGMRSLLVLYMVDHLFLRPDIGEKVLGLGLLKAGIEAIFGPLEAQPLSSQIYGFYTALVYLTPFYGGMLADKVLGKDSSVPTGSECLTRPTSRYWLVWALAQESPSGWLGVRLTGTGGTPSDDRRD